MVGELVELVAAELAGLAGHVDSLDRRCRGERLELGPGERVGEVDQLHAEAHVGLVDTEAVHRLVPRHPFDRRPLARDRFVRREHGLGDRRQHVVLRHEAHLDIELHELVLAIGAQVLVTQAAGDLVVAVESRHHQELLEQLRRLGQRVERAGFLAGRHEELPGALRRRRHQHRRLDLDEALGVHRPAERAVDGSADADVSLHALAAQVEVAVLEADVLVDLVGPGVDRERRRGRHPQHLDLALADLDLAGRQVRVDRALRSGPHDAGDPHDVLAAHVHGVVDDALDHARVVTDVDERQVLAVLPAPGDPSTHRNRLADVDVAQLPTRVRAHRGGPGDLVRRRLV